MATTRRERDKRESRKTDAAAWAEKQSQGYEPTAVKLADGIKLYKLEEGTHEFDIMPFVAGEGNPRADEGFQHFEHEYNQHRIPRPDGNADRFCCLASKPWEEFCPVCKVRPNFVTVKGDGQKDDPLRLQTRHLFVINPNPGKTKGPFQVMDAVHYNRKLGFGEQLVIAIGATRDGGNLADLKEGFTVRVVVADAKYGQVSRVDLMKRDYEYPDSMLKDESAYWTVLKPTKAQLLKALGQAEAGVDDEDETPERNGPPTAKKKASPVEEDDEDAAPKKSAKKAAVDEDEDDDMELDNEDNVRSKKTGKKVDEEEDERPSRAAGAAKKTASARSRSDDEEEEDDSDLEPEDSDEDEEDEKPVKKKGKKADPDEDDDEDEDDDDSVLEDEGWDEPEEEAPTKKGKPVKSKKQR